MGCGVTGNSPSNQVLAPLTRIRRPLPASNVSEAKKYLSIRPLGEGGSSEVILSRYLPDSTFRAVKIVAKIFLCEDQVDSKDNLTEVSLLHTLKHNNIVKVFEAFQNNDCFFVPLEFCQGGSLWSKLKGFGAFSEEDTALIMRQIFNALDYIHERKIVHRDVKAENVLFCNSEGLEIKIADFGNACKLDKNGKAKGSFGTIYYMAPEVFSGPYNEKVDLWSAGILMFILLTGRAPYKGKTQGEIQKAILHQAFSIKKHEKLFKNPELVNLFSKLLKINPAERITAKEALKHPWIVSLTQKQGEKQAKDTELSSGVLKSIIYCTLKHRKAESKEIGAKQFSSTHSQLHSIGKNELEEKVICQIGLKGKDEELFREFMRAVMLAKKKEVTEFLRKAFRQLKKTDNGEVPFELVEEMMEKFKDERDTFGISEIEKRCRGLTWNDFVKVVEGLEIEDRHTFLY
jgi:calcium-dependent protein kinase